MAKIDEDTGGDDEVDEISVRGVIDQRGRKYAAVTRGGKTAFTRVDNFLLGIATPVLELAAQGVIIVQPKHQKTLREQVDQIRNPTERILLADRPGWVTRDSYVLLDGTVIAKGAPRTKGIVIAFGRRPDAAARGTLADWHRKIGAFVENQPLLQGLVCFAFSGLLLRHYGRTAGVHDNPMLNLVGPSSCGKTTGLRVLQSLYGTAPPRTWLATSNAMEDLAQEANDSALLIDESLLAGFDHRSRSQNLSAAVMSMSTGMVKARKGQTAPPPARFSVVSTSNTYIASYGGNTAAIDPALQVRMCVIDLVGRKHGILDRAGPSGAAAIINRLNMHASSCGGAPVRSFLVRFTDAVAKNKAELDSVVNAAIREFRQVAGRGTPFTEMEGRIVGRFALAYAAGVLARRWHVLPSSWVGIHAGTMTLFTMAKEVLNANAHSDPVARFEWVLARIRPMLHEESAKQTQQLATFLGSIRLGETKGLELLMRKPDFDVTFGSIDRDLLGLLRTTGALADPEAQANGRPRTTVKRVLFPGRPPERVIAIRLDRRAYPGALKIVRPVD